MAKRGGKAASRRERQRRAQQQALRMVSRTPPAQSTDLREAVAAVAEERAAAPAPAPRPAAGSVSRAGRGDPRFMVSGPSRLGERASAEYHYVLRDLRSIGILLSIMVALLAVATIALGAIRG
jgi:hypothetical protein